MRVSNKIIFDNVKLNLAKITEELNRANMVVATQKRILKLSDDPVGLTQVLSMKSSLSNIEQLSRNISMGKSWLVASESAQTSVQDLVSEAKALCVQMASANTGAAERRSAAEIVQNTLEEVVSLANTQVNGRYVFAGSKTDAAAFTLNSDNSVTYNGDSNPFTIKIGKDATVEIGGDGQAAFQPSGAGGSDDIFRILKDLKTALQGNDISGIQTAMTNLDTHFDHNSAQIADVGSKMIRMEIKDNVLQNLDIATTESLSKIEDAEITEAIMDLKAKEVAYQAALAASSKVLQLSLVNYM
ncbi:MAG: flagellar hook-associated protein FlgL [Deltaproteobacteria bacterium]|nr:flagellar hook-associated protein FlgL [Deltaproteobacteria bacterium]